MSYWTDRVKARQRIYDRSSARVGRMISDAHERMLKDIREDARRIFGNFEKAFDLSPAEARALLKSPLPEKEAALIRSRLDDIEDPQYKKLMQARLSSGAYAHRLSRLDATRASAEIAAIRVADVEKTVGQQHLEDVFYQGYGRTMFDVQQYTGIGFGFDGVDERRVKQVLRNRWSGKNYSARVWANNQAMSRELSKALLERIMQGKTSRETFRALMAQSDMGRFAANRLLATETTYIATQATIEAYEDAGITHYIFLAVLDGRTSQICQDHDQKVYPLAEAEVGVNLSPMHPWCRSTTQPHIDGLVRERMERWARHPETGEEMRVPAGTTYRQWRESLKTVDGKQAPTLADKVEATLAKQKADAERLRDRKQWERYREALGNENVPKTLSGFINAKKANNELFQGMKLDYRRRNALTADPSRALPNAAKATAADEKFTGYLFNQNNSGGWAKGVAFRSRLGYDQTNWRELKTAILSNADKYPVTIHKSNEHGTHYEQLTVLYGLKGRPANVLVAWTYKDGQTHMSNAYVKEVKADGTD